MKVNCPIAIVGAGVFAHNLNQVFRAGGFQVEFFVDEIKSGTYMDLPIRRAADLQPTAPAVVEKFVVAISHKEYREAAISRLLEQNITPEKIISLTDDHVIPILNLIFSEFGNDARDFFASQHCRSVFDLERHFFGNDWERARVALDPEKPTLAFCFYGRGGGFRRHIRGLIPRLKNRFNVLALLDEKLSGEGFDIPELFMGPDTASQLDRIDLDDVDLSLTAHFIACSASNQPKVNFLHTSFDFILDPDWILDRFETADPHYIFTSTQATFDWMKSMVGRRQLNTRVCLIPGGYTRLDENLRHAEAYTGPVDSLIYAPTLSLNAVQHHELTYSAPWASEILQGMIDSFSQHNIIFRPHPNDLQLLQGGRNDELARPFISALQLSEDNPHSSLDTQKTFYMDSYNRAAVMVSDTSSTAYTYALTTCRPVVFFSPHDEQVREIFSAESAFIRDRERIGRVVGTVEEMVAAIGEMTANLESWGDKVRAYRDEICFNPGHTEEYFVENIDFILDGKKHPDWFYLNWEEPS